jgi:Tol biopolymer transport system component
VVTDLEPTQTDELIEATATVIAAPTEAPTEAPTSTAEPMIETTPVGGGSGKLAYASDRNGEIQIYMVDVLTKEVSQITTIPGGACQPDFSPDGTKIVFTSPCAKDQQDYTGSRLFVMNVDGSGLLPLNTVPGGDFDPKWNPADSNQIIFTSYRENSRPHLFIYQLDDRTVTSLSPVIAYDRAAEWSPDGKYVVFQQVYEGVNGIFYMEIDTLKRIGLSDLQLESTSPAWSKDGSLIYFSQGKSLPALIGRQFNNLSSPAVNISDIKPIWDVTFSQDGYWVGFMGLGTGTNRDIFMMLNTGGLLENLTNDSAYDFDPVFQP